MRRKTFYSIVFFALLANTALNYNLVQKNVENRGGTRNHSSGGIIRSSGSSWHK